MSLKRVFNLFLEPPVIDRIKDKAKVDKLYKHWRVRMLYSTFIGYAIFYFCRKNISIALPLLGSDLGFTNVQLGTFSTLLYVTYGIGKFSNGIIALKANPRYFMAFGLIMTAVMNILFGLSSAFWSLAIFWGINGWFQSMGIAPCAKTIANWFSVSERGTKWAVWHISHQIGAFVIAILAGFLANSYGWRSAFFVPAAIALVTAIFVIDRMRDTPPTLGFPNIADYKNDHEYNKDGSVIDDKQESTKYILLNRVLNNKYIWLVAFMNLFVYVIRSGTFDWATKFLVEAKGSNVAKAGIMVSLLELVGIAGVLLAGVLSDKIWHGKRAPWCAICFMFVIVGLGFFYFVPPGHAIIDSIVLAVIGFFVYGPQFLVGLFVIDLASRKGASAANGLAGVFGYAGAAISGMGTGYFLDNYGWAGGFSFWVACAVIGMIICILIWNVKAGNKTPTSMEEESEKIRMYEEMR